MQEKTLEELLKELRWIPSGGGCMDASCEGCEWEEKERFRIEGEIASLVEKAREEGRKEVWKDTWSIDGKTIKHIDLIRTQYKEELLEKIQNIKVPPYPVENEKLNMLQEGAVIGFQECLSEVKKIIN